MGAIAALLALGGIVALAAYSAGGEEAERRAGSPPAGAGEPPPALPPPPLPPAQGSSIARAPAQPSQGQPAPSQPAPSQPTPSQPTPSQPPPTPSPASPTAATETRSESDPYAATPIPSHCPARLNRADPTARDLCGPREGSSTSATAPVRPASTTATSAPPDLAQRVRAFLESDPSPERIDELATQLERAGLSEAARQLRQVAAARRRAQAASPSPSPSPSSPSVEPPPGPPSPAGTPGTSSSSATDSGSSPRPDGSGEPPSGRQLAASVAEALRSRLSEIQRITRAFQDAAGIATDGQYGPVTRAALTYWSGRTAPRPWVGSGQPSYRVQDVERGDGSPTAERAERTARQLFAALLEPEGDARPLVERLQRMVGLTVDGKYGRQTRAALGRLGVANPPRAFRRTRRRTGRRGSSRRRSG